MSQKLNYFVSPLLRRLAIYTPCSFLINKENYYLEYNLTHMNKCSFQKHTFSNIEHYGIA